MKNPVGLDIQVLSNAPFLSPFDLKVKRVLC